ncbi:MAG: hypothetical protein IIY97_05795 [Firmicutes bacterium]|nr:hypothetical protein [Bacillota bacterium]
MKEFRGIVKERDRNTKILYAAVAVLFVALEIMRHKWVYIPLALLVLAACFLEKEQVINEKGITTRLKVFSFIHENTWRWEDIDSLSFDYRKKAPDMVLNIRWDIKVRSYIMRSPDSAGIKELAKEMNPRIKIESLN